MANNQLLDVVEACVLRHGAHLIDVVQSGAGGNQVVEVFIDNENGITTELCASISRDVSTSLDVLLKGAYRLTVSSPGIDRPLKYPWQFKKHAGRELIIIWNADGNQKQTVGKLVSVSNTELIVSTGEPKEGFPIDFDAIKSAKVKIPW